MLRHLYATDRAYGKVLICCDNGSGIWRSPPMLRHWLHAEMLRHRYHVCCDLYISLAAKLVVTSNGYVTCGIARLQVIATCCESTHVRRVSCNVSRIWNVVVT